MKQKKPGLSYSRRGKVALLDRPGFHPIFSGFVRSLSHAFMLKTAALQNNTPRA
jgi:hypothetical protein